MARDITDWLRDLGLEQYAPAFRDNEIDGDLLPTLTADDLKDLGITVVGHRRKLLNAIAGLSEQAAPESKSAVALDAERRRPVLFVLEDAHWIDPTTLELVELCLERITDARALILATARPGFDHGFGGHPIVTRLALNRLGRAQTAAIVERAIGRAALPEALLDEIAIKTDGVPPFVEELTKAVLESGETGIPASLHDSLMARLDRIPDVKAVAQVAAVIGRVFDTGSWRRSPSGRRRSCSLVSISSARRSWRSGTAGRPRRAIPSSMPWCATPPTRAS